MNYNNYDVRQEIDTLLKFQFGHGNVLAAKEVNGLIHFEVIDRWRWLWRGLTRRELDEIKFGNVDNSISTFIVSVMDLLCLLFLCFYHFTH